jgi:hypothetical protein
MTEPAEHPDVLYDFLYKDIGRIASYYAQVFRGRLTGVEESASDRDVHETLLKGNVAVASGEFKSVGDIQSATRRSIDPHDVITTDILASLMDDGFVTQNVNEAPHGTLVLAQGTLVFIERSMLELAAVSMDMAVQNSSGRGGSSPDRTSRQMIKFVKDFLSKLVLPSAFVIRMPSGLRIAGTIKDAGMEEPISSYYFKHGAAGLAEVYIIGIKEVPSEAFSLPQAQLIGAGQQAAQVLSNLLFPPEAIRVTPLALFRKLTKIEPAQLRP